MLSELETHRLRDGMRAVSKASTHDWRFYFSYILGRHVSLVETQQFLVNEDRTHREPKLA